jgi:serine protease AprX
VIRNERGRRGERNSALWGTGNRGGESRSNALWGKGGRGALLAAVASLAMVLPLAASAGKSTVFTGNGSTYVSPSLLEHAKKDPGAKVSVIIRSTDGLSAAKNAYSGLGLSSDVRRELGLVGAVAVDVPASKLDKLAEMSNLVVTPDAPAKVSAETTYSNLLWPYEAGNASLWYDDLNYLKSSTPTIAIVDSGVDASKVDYAGRLLGQVNLSTLPNNSAGDGRGHGTFVAGIAASSKPGIAGAAPAAKLFSIDVMDDRGVGRTSDIIAACEWIFQNKDRYNIRVANFSLHSATQSKATLDPLDKAVEKLWFAGVTVVAAAGNYGTTSGPSGVRYAPGNDPFVITVGAADLGGTYATGDDSIAPWSAYGYTYDGFRKPELSAPGRYMVGPIPGASTLALERADKLVYPGYIQLSGTSFAAPVVAGAAAQILARHPEWTPDQVKGALMKSARPVPGALPGSAGVGQVNAKSAAQVVNAPNPNKSLNQFVVSASGGSGKVWNTASWETTVQSNASWDTASWLDASWLDASWDTASWLDASWLNASWLDASWLNASWLDASWLDASWEDTAEGDASSSSDFNLDSGERSEVGLPKEMLPPPNGTLG